MWGAAIEYKSGTYHINGTTNVLETTSHEGIECVWSGRIPNISVFSSHKINFTWNFDWNKLRNQGVDEITGHITVTSAFHWFPPMKIDVKLTENNREVTTDLGIINNTEIVYYEYSLTPHYTSISEKPSYCEMFAPSDQNDTILIVDGKKLHVSKAFLSYHSEYFRALFSSNFKEGQMDEIPIEDVSYEDFALLLSTFYPNPVFPTDRTVEKLLEMGRRFLVSSAISSAEHHLITNSTIENEEMLWLADEYGMPTLLEKCIRKITTVEDAKKMKKSEKYGQLSDKTKVKLYERLVDSIIWSGTTNDSELIDFTWEFDWSELKKQGVDEITGHITIESADNWFIAEIDVILTEDHQIITKQVSTHDFDDVVSFNYTLVPCIPVESVKYRKMFAPSDQNDTILIVDGKKLHVSKAFLSYHSEYFRALFSSNFKEGQMDKIPIEDVSFEDFALLLSTFYPNQVFPNDETAEKLLEMARRFLVSSAISISDYHLLNNSKIDNEKMILLADEYVLPSLLEKCIRELDTVEKVKKLHQSPEYEMLSDNTKVKVLDILIKMV